MLYHIFYSFIISVLLYHSQYITCSYHLSELLYFTCYLSHVKRLWNVSWLSVMREYYIVAVYIHRSDTYLNYTCSYYTTFVHQMPTTRSGAGTGADQLIRMPTIPTVTTTPATPTPTSSSTFDHGIAGAHADPADARNGPPNCQHEPEPELGRKPRACFT